MMSRTGPLVTWEKMMQALPERCVVCNARTAEGYLRLNQQEDGTLYAFVCRECAYGLYDIVHPEVP